MLSCIPRRVCEENTAKASHWRSIRSKAEEFEKKQQDTRYNGWQDSLGAASAGCGRKDNRSSGSMKKKRAVPNNLKHIGRWLLALVLLSVFVLLASDFYVSFSTRNYLYTRMDELPERPVAVVLGTSRHYAGKINPFYKSRIEAAAQLYAAKKVRAIVVSGDNATRQYNEPRMLRKDLIASGVPADFVTMDFAGFRTLDSIVRAKEVFKLNSFVVVSQRFQVERALYIARAHNIEAIGFAAENPSYFGWRWRVRLREVFARFLAVLDVTVLDTMPKFLGPKVDVNIGLPVPKIELPGFGGNGDTGAVPAEKAAPSVPSSAPVQSPAPAATQP